MRKVDKQIFSSYNKDNTVNNMFDKNLQHRTYQLPGQGGFGQSRVSVPALFNPQQVESRTGVGGTNDAGLFHPFRSLYSTNPGTLDNGWDLKRNQSNYLAALNSMNVNGFRLSGNGANYDVRPETVEFLQATMPYYTDDLSKGAEERVHGQIGSNVRNLYEKQGIWQGMNGFSKYNTTIQQDLNAMYQHALWEMQSKDPEVQKHGRNMMGVIARGQQVFNEAQPEVTKGIQAKVQPYKNFLNNNWWWMLPAGGLLVGALAGDFGGNGGQQQPSQPTAQPGVMSSGLPEGWTAPLANPVTEAN